MGEGKKGKGEEGVRQRYKSKGKTRESFQQV